MDIEDVLWTLLPLVLLVVISWALSFLGSRVANKTQEGMPVQDDGRDEQSTELLFDEEERELLGPSKPEPAERPQRPAYDEPSDFETPGVPGAPRVTPDPIRPKWWGA